MSATRVTPARAIPICTSPSRNPPHPANGAAATRSIHTRFSPANNNEGSPAPREARGGLVTDCAQVIGHRFASLRLAARLIVISLWVAARTQAGSGLITTALFRVQ